MCMFIYILIFNVLFIYRMVWPNWAHPLSCAPSPTQTAVHMVRFVVLMESVKWTAALKMPTPLTLWSQHGKTGQSQPYLTVGLVNCFQVRACEQ